MHARGAKGLASSATMVTPGALQITRYDQLKESVRALRPQVRASRVPSRKSQRSPPHATLVTPPSAAHAPLGIPSDDPATPHDGSLEDVDPQESFSMQHLRLQFKIELQVQHGRCVYIPHTRWPGMGWDGLNRGVGCAEEAGRNQEAGCESKREVTADRESGE
jgi:hypothetical protein